MKTNLERKVISLLSSSTSGYLGTFQVQPPFPFGQPWLFGQSSVGSGQSTGFAQTSGGAQSSSGSRLGFPATSGAPRTPVFTGPSGTPSASGFSFKMPTSFGAFPSAPGFGHGSREAAGCSLGPSEFSFKAPESSTFRPIFGAQWEPKKTQSHISPGSFSFSLPVSGGPEALGSCTVSQGASSSGTSLSAVGSGQSTAFAQSSGGTQSSSGSRLGFPATSGAPRTPVLTAPSGTPSASGFSFKTPTSFGAFPSAPGFGHGSREAAGCSLGPSEFSFKAPESSTFRPIFGAQWEPKKTQSHISPGSFSFSLPVSGGPEALGSCTVSQGASSSGTSLSAVGSGQSTAFAQSSGGTQSSSGSRLGFPATSGAPRTPVLTAPSGTPSASGFSFKTPTSFGAFPSAPGFGHGSREAAGCSLGPSEFSFKAPESSTFRPIFGAQWEPKKTQSHISPGSFSFSLPVSGGPEALGSCTVSQGASSSGTSPSLPFSKPTGDPPSSTFASLRQNVEEEMRGPKPAFGSSGSSFTSFASPGSVGEPFSRSKAAGRQGTEDAGGQGGSLSGHVKGLKRKKDHDRSPRRRDDDSVEDTELLSWGAHPPKKRPPRLARPRAGGLFGGTLQDKLRSTKGGGHLGSKEMKREVGSLESSETDQGAGAPATSSKLSAPRLKEDGQRGQEVSAARATASRRRGKKESVQSSSSPSPRELPALQCKNIPNDLKDGAILQEHFGPFGKVQRIHPRRRRKLATVPFSDPASAALAREKGQGSQKVLIFWRKNKRSPRKKNFSPKEKISSEREARQSWADSPLQRSPLPKALWTPATGQSSSLLTKSSPGKKTSHSKSLPCEGEPLEGGPEVPSSDKPGLSVTAVSTLMGAVAETSEDKYRLLDRRDKILRQALVKRTDVDQAKAFLGTCRDMCPEKERYMRETRKQLSSFEVIPGTDQVDHAAAIKEYSRSSAGQEEPLPQELRPSGVLGMTMDYLVTQVMDRREGSSRDWYDFVWNRTRAIRKDITQQHLGDPLTVSLIEKCARFHIHCAHWMCEEPMGSFDAKINQENMTKCLRSLTEMYQDLADKGVLCAREAEFRGYHVLLNLNQGDVLREVQQFRPEVRKSPEVNFAVQAFAALHSNNFVRFFKLVRSASYLNACLLHCYFHQIRKAALRALNVAYTGSPRRSTRFPVDHLVPMLLFGDAEEASDFLSSCGLAVSDGCVELKRSAFLEAGGLAKAKKCPLISEKLTVSVGEVVNGGPLPPVPRHIPLCSFNPQNEYVGESAAPESALSGQKPSVERGGGGKMEEGSRGAEVLALGLPPQPRLPPPRPLPPQTAGLPPALRAPAPVQPLAASSSGFQPVGQPELPPAKPRPSYTDSDLVGVVEDLAQDVLRGYCEEVGQAGAAYAAAAWRVSEMVAEELLATTTEDVLRQTAAEELQEERARIREEQERAEEQRRGREKERLLADGSQGLEAEAAAECEREISSQELKSAVESERRACLARSSEDVCDSLLDLFLPDEIFQSARETLQELQGLCHYWQRWRKALAARNKLKRQKRAFPEAPCRVDLSTRLQALAPSAERPIAKENPAKGVLNLGHAGKLGLSCTKLQWMRNKTIHQMKVQYFYRQLLREAAWSPLDLPGLLAEHYPGQREQVFWKLVLLLPDGEEPDSEEEPASGCSGRILANWLKVKFMGCEDFQKGARHASQGLQTLTLLNAWSTKGDRAVRVNVCIKVAHGLLSDRAPDGTETQQDLLGTSGLLFLLPARDESVVAAEREDDAYWLSALLRLKQLLQAKPSQPPLPLVVLVPGGEGASVRDVEAGLRLQDLLSSQLISDYMISEIPAAVNDLQGTNRVSQAVRWLVSRCPSCPELCCRTLPQYIEDGVSREFSERFFHDRRQRRGAGLASQEPGAIIELFNGVLQFLADVASSEQLCHLSWPIAEFAEPGGNKLLPPLRWNAPGHLAWLKKVVLSFQLPPLDLPAPGAPWPLVCNTICQYVSQIPSCGQTQPILQSQLENLLRRTYGKWRNGDLGASGDTGPRVEEIPWDDIIALCINHKLRDWQPPTLPVTSEALSQDGQICVYFFESHFKSFQVPGAWEHARLQTHKEIQRHGHGRLGTKPLRSAESLSPAWLHVPYGGTGAPESRHAGRVPDAEELARTASAEELLPGRLAASLRLEKEESRKFEDQLRRWLSGDGEQGPDSSPLPVYLPQALLSTPHTLRPVLRVSAPSSPRDQKAAEWRRPAPAMGGSLSDKLRHLESRIQRTRQEELVWERHLSNLVDMVAI